MGIEEFTQKFIEQSKKGNIVVVTGAGMSTASGIKDFRGVNGLYKEHVDAETILSIKYFENHPKEFYDFYKKFLTVNEDVLPNKAHYLLKELESENLVAAIVTQNIDGLDIKAGSKKVIEIHGNGMTFTCTGCGKKYSSKEVLNIDGVPYCDTCNSVLKPDIILYGENLNESDFFHAKGYINMATTLLVIGSSLVVNPIAGFVQDFAFDVAHDRTNNKKLFVVNMGKTSVDFKPEVIKYDGSVIDFAEEYQRQRTKK